TCANASAAPASATSTTMPSSVAATGRWSFQLMPQSNWERLPTCVSTSDSLALKRGGAEGTLCILSTTAVGGGYEFIPSPPLQHYNVPRPHRINSQPHYLLKLANQNRTVTRHHCSNRNE